MRLPSPLPEALQPAQAALAACWPLCVPPSRSFVAQHSAPPRFFSAVQTCRPASCCLRLPAPPWGWRCCCPTCCRELWRSVPTTQATHPPGLRPRPSWLAGSCRHASLHAYRHAYTEWGMQFVGAWSAAAGELCSVPQRHCRHASRPACLQDATASAPKDSLQLPARIIAAVLGSGNPVAEVCARSALHLAVRLAVCVRTFRRLPAQPADLDVHVLFRRLPLPAPTAGAVAPG